MTSSYKKYFDPAQIESDQKDLVISQLKAELFELRQNERDYNELHSKLNNLEHRYTLVQEEIGLNEREFRNRNELNVRTINNLKSDIHNLKQEFHVISDDIQDLRLDNQSLNEVVDNKNRELSRLKDEVADLTDNNGQLTLERKDLENQISRVRSELRETTIELEDNTLQTGEATEKRNKLERLIKELEYETERLERNNEELQRAQDGLRLNIRSRTEATKHNEQLYAENRKQIIAREADLNDLRRVNDKLKTEINTNQKSQQADYSKNLEAQSRINKLESFIKERDYEVDQFRREYEELKREQLKLLDTNDDLSHDVDACARHLDLITLQNNELVHELERLNLQDQEVRRVLDRRDRVDDVKKRYEGKTKNSYYNMNSSLRSPTKTRDYSD